MKIYLQRDQVPPESLINELFAIAADIHTKQAVFVPERFAAEPMVWDRNRGMFIFIK